MGRSETPSLPRHRTAARIAVAALVSAVVVQMLVVAGVVPYRWVNGGRSPSAAAGRGTSAVSAAVLVVLSLAEAWATGLWRGGRDSAAKTIARWVVAVLIALTTVQQVLGTTFERALMLPLCLVMLAGAVLAARR